MVTAVSSRQSRTVAKDNGVAGLLLRIPAQAHTLEGFTRWVLSQACPEKLRVTFVKGEIYLDMSQEEIRSHVAVKTEIYRVLFAVNNELDLGDLYPDGVLIKNEEAQVSNNPDGVAVFWESLQAGRVCYVGHSDRDLIVEGTPDWVMEIVSDSSVIEDTRDLRAAYHKARIPEYWLIDARGTDIDFRILWWRKSGYADAPNKDGWQRSRVFGRSFRLTRRRDRRGAWKYVLEMRE